MRKIILENTTRIMTIVFSIILFRFAVSGYFPVWLGVLYMALLVLVVIFVIVLCMDMCMECGCELPDGSKYCPCCGHKVEKYKRIIK